VTATEPSTRAESRPRLAPSPGLGIAAYLSYVVVIVAVNLIGGVDYDELTDNTENLLKGVILPVGIGGLVTIGFATRYGWWGLALRERPAGPRWLLVVPLLVVLGCVAGAVETPWDDFGTDLLVMLVVATAMVGFAEELTTRGVLLVGLRGRFRELWVWAISTGLFAAMHSLNFVSGQPLDKTAAQVAATFFIGTALYASRRITGLLVVPMALHFLWDFTLFTSQGPAGAVHHVSETKGLQGTAMVLAVVVALFALRGLFRARDEQSAAA
jgi:CAAX protease family protein